MSTLQQYAPINYNPNAAAPVPAQQPGMQPAAPAAPAGADPNQMPALPGYLDPNGNLTGAASINPATSGQTYAGSFQAAMPSSQSPWAAMQGNLIDTQTQQARDAAANSGAAATQGALDAAASHGGVTGGGSARIAAIGSMGTMQGQQGATLAGNQAKQQAGITDLQTLLKNNQFNAQQQQQGGQFNAQQGNQIGMFNAGQQNTAANINAGNTINANNWAWGQKNNQFIGNQLGNAMDNTQNNKGTWGALGSAAGSLNPFNSGNW